MKVFILGVTGSTGRRLALRLIATGDSVGGLCRRAEQMAGLRALGVAPVLGDLSDITAQQFATALADSDAVVFTAGAGEADDARIDAIDGRGVSKTLAAARMAGISRLLLVSVFPDAWRGQNAPPSFEHYIRVKKAADVELVHSGLDWLILRPSSLTEEPGTGRMSLSAAELHTTLSRDDLAATIAALLHAPLGREVLELTAGCTPIALAVDRLLEVRAAAGHQDSAAGSAR